MGSYKIKANCEIIDTLKLSMLDKTFMNRMLYYKSSCGFLLRTYMHERFWMYSVLSDNLADRDEWYIGQMYIFE